MPILIECPHCGECGEVSRSTGGREVKCDKCGRGFRVPVGAGHVTVEWGVGRTGTRVLIVPGREVRIGRAPDNDLVLPGEKVSRHHARLRWTDDGWVIEDLGSANGTTVDGNRIKAAVVGGGSRFSVGDYVLRMTLASAQPAAGDTALDALASHESSLSGYPTDELTGVAAARKPIDPSAETLLNGNAPIVEPPARRHPSARPAPAAAKPAARRMPGWVLLAVLAAVMIAVVALAWRVFERST